VRFFTQRQKLRGSVCFALGFFMVISGYTFFGMIVESFGFINLFGYAARTDRLTVRGPDAAKRRFSDFFPAVIGFLRSLPVIGPILNAPGVNKVSGRRRAQQQSLPHRFFFFAQVVDWIGGSGRGQLPV